jgi:hypothetical protein
MRKLLALGALMGLVAFVTATAHAQRPFGGFGGSSGGGIFLLMNKGVQEELKITEEQQTKLRDKTKGIFEKFQEIRAKVKDVPEADRQEKTQKLMKEIEEASTKEISEVLKPEQMKRFKQIQRQQSVVTTLLNDEEAGKALDLSAEQKDAVKAVDEELHKQLAELRQQFNSETLEKSAVARKEANEKALKTLTDVQQKKWKELTGEPFEVKQEGFGLRKKDKNN